MKSVRLTMMSNSRAKSIYDELRVRIILSVFDSKDMTIDTLRDLCFSTRAFKSTEISFRHQERGLDLGEKSV